MRTATAASLGAGAALLATSLVGLRADAATMTTQKINVTATEYSFQGFPASVKGGLTTITLTNKGKKPHSMQLVWVDGKHTDAEIAKVVGSESGPIPSWLHGGGGVPTVPPGGTGSATVNLRKATYAFWSDESDDSAGTSDLKSGMKGRFTATTDKASSEPTAAATITAKDYGFDVTGLEAGKNTVAFANSGKELHLVVMFPLLPGKTIADMTKALSADPTAKDAPPPPFDPVKIQSLPVIDTGVAQVSDVTLAKGHWAFVCFINDRAGGPPHFMKGMIKDVLIA